MIKKYFFFGRKKPTFYKGLLIKADLDLHDQMADSVVAKIQKQAEILDLGAGEGAFSWRLHDLGYKVTALDVDELNFKCTEVNFNKIDFNNTIQVENYIDLNFQKFDAIICQEVIEHIENPWELMRLINKLLKPNGLVFLSTPNTTNWYSRLQFLIHGRFVQFGDADLDYGHISPITPWEISVIIKSTGFELIKIKEAGVLTPIFFDFNFKTFVFNLISLPLRIFQRGILNGWSIIIEARKN